MKLKKWIALTSALCLTVGITAAATACGGESSVAFTITVKDQDGDLIEHATLALAQDNKEICELTTDKNGQAVATAKLGEYSIVYKALPDLFEGIPTQITLTKDSSDIEITVEDWNFGSSLEPYVCFYGTDEETGESHDYMTVPTILAYSDAYYTIRFGSARTITVDQADVTIVYDGVSYNAANGSVEIQLLGEVGDMNKHPVIQILNETDMDLEIVITLSADASDEGKTE
jgi:hypothetical protein